MSEPEATERSLTRREHVGGIWLIAGGFGAILAGFFYAAVYRSDFLIVTGPSPNPEWPWGAAVALIVGLACIGAGLAIVRPGAPTILIGFGVAIMLIGASHYFWTDVLHVSNWLPPNTPYPTINWAVTVPVSLVGLGLLSCGVVLRLRNGGRKARDLA